MTSPSIQAREFPEIRRLTESAVMLTATDEPDLPSQQKIWQLAKILRESPRHGELLIDIVPGMGNLLLMCEATRSAAMTDLAAALPALWQQIDPLASEGRRVTVPVIYGGEAGPDLPVVAAHTGLSEEEVIRRHSAVQYPVFCLGFQPGFAYLGGLDSSLHTPRRSRPRTSVAAGSVGIGGNQTGIYPSPSPAGWQIIGRTSEKLFDVNNKPPCLLQPGDIVCFVRQN
jgi:KipI family sensor histidine kinase inhibitor